MKVKIFKGILLLSHVSENREEFTRLRQGKIGSSDIAAICGIDPYRTRMKVWAEMTGRIPRTEDNDTLWLGRRMESIVADLFSRRTGYELFSPDAVYQSSLVSWAIASPDRFFERQGRTEIVECKAPRVFQKAKWSPVTAPDTAHLQLIWQMGHLGLEWGHCAALLGGNTEDFYMPEFHFDKVTFDQAMAMADDFMKLVKNDTPPMAQAEDRELTELLFKEPTEEIVDLPPEMSVLLDEWGVAQATEQRLKLSVKNAERVRHQKEALLSMALGNAKVGRFPGYLLLRQNWKRTGFTVQPKEGVRFRVKKTGDKNEETDADA